MRTSPSRRLLPFLLAFALPAQGPEPAAGFVALHQACLDAGTDGVVLNVAAHPDDEASRTDVMLRRRYGVRVVTVYSTYGDGGQNAIGKEIGPELAALRVRETLRAAALSGVEVRWLGMKDFGFSKTLDETLRAWDGDKLLAAMRAVVDAVEPDFVITNHTLDQGHGHHRASYWAITKVLEERAAKGRHVPPLYTRCPPEKAQWTVDPAELDLASGETFARLAHRAWTQHVTQGPWGAHNPLQVGKDHWRVAFPEGVATEQARDPVTAWVQPRARHPELQARLAAMAAETAPATLAHAAGELLPALRAPAGTGTEAGRDRSDDVQRVLLAGSGVAVETWLDKEEVAVGGKGKVLVVVHGADKVQGIEVRCGDARGEPVKARPRGTPFDGMPAPPAGVAGAAAGAAAVSPANEGTSEAPTTPAAPPEPAGPPTRFEVAFAAGGQGDAAPSGPEPAWVAVEVRFTLGGVPIAVQRRHWYTPVAPVELRWDRDVVMVPKGQTVERIVSASVISHRDGELAEPVRLGMGAGLKAEAIPGRIALAKEHPEARLLVRATIAADELGADSRLRIEAAGQRAELRIVPVEVFVPPGLKVGLVRGPDDTTERALADLGIAYTALDRDALATARLEEFTTLLLDIRAYHHRPELAEHRDRILQFCRAGGRVVAMYHKPGEWNERAGHPLLAPFPLTVGDERITEEDTAVRFLQPEHRLVHHPHVLTAQDFAGWVQERGLNFPAKMDAAWLPLFELQDSSDKKPHQGGLLWTQYGRGDFVYCSLALYRQLRAGNAGAARLLVNLLSR